MKISAIRFSNIVLILIVLYLLSCATFQDQIVKANEEIDDYSFERCAKVRIELLAATLQRESKIYLFSKKFESKFLRDGKEFWNLGYVLEPSFNVEFVPDSDAVVELKLLKEADNNNDRYISLEESELTILNYLVRGGVVHRDNYGANFTWTDQDGNQRNMSSVDFRNYYIKELCPDSDKK